MVRLSGEEKGAWLLKALGPEATAKVMSQLGPERAERLRALMQRLQPRPELQSALNDLLRELEEALRAAPEPEPAPARFAAAPAPVPPPSPATPSAAPPNVAAPRLAPALTGDPLQALASLPTDRLAQVLDGESARTVSLILNYLDVEQAGAVFKGLPAALRGEVSVQFSVQATPQRQVLDRIAQALLLKNERLTEKPLFSEGQARWRKMADMLRLLDKPDRVEVLAALETKDAAGAAAIRELLYRFEDVLRLDNRSTQKMLGDIDGKTLAVALKNAAGEIVDKFMANLSKRAQDNLAEELELMRLVPKDQIEQAQKDIVAVLQRMDLAGQVTMSE
jgi:flagellar motor switch protein FliG